MNFTVKLFSGSENYSSLFRCKTFLFVCLFFVMQVMLETIGPIHKVKKNLQTIFFLSS